LNEAAHKLLSNPVIEDYKLEMELEIGMNFAVLQFPASNCDQDAVHAFAAAGHSARLVWHKDASLGDTMS
jgi:hypothetical protein